MTIPGIPDQSSPAPAADANSEDLSKLVLDMRAEMIEAHHALTVLAQMNLRYQTLLEEWRRAPKFSRHMDWHRWQADYRRKVDLVLGTTL